jgi:hypothetical protein
MAELELLFEPEILCTMGLCTLPGPQPPGLSAKDQAGTKTNWEGLKSQKSKDVFLFPNQNLASLTLNAQLEVE